jgi:hypothetical protein
MHKCPNCAQETAKTRDWACPWCGYPLLSDKFEEMPETYQQLQAEKRRKQRQPPKEQAEEFNLAELSPLTPAQPAEIRKNGETSTPERVLTPTPVEVTSGAYLREHGTAAPAPTSQPETPRRLIPDSEHALTMAPLEVTVEELYSLIANQSFKVTGIVDKVVLNEDYNVYYVILTSAKSTLEVNVQCTFDRTHVSELNQLAKGQTVTVQGKYAGYIINMLMRDCSLVR